MAVVALGREQGPFRPRSAPVATALGPVEVLDGDTLRLEDGRRVRLAAVDTPERGHPGAERAAARVRELLAGATPLMVPADPPRDRYGRLLADVEIDGRSLSATLVEEGLAWVYMADDPALLALQVEAIDAGRGVHAGLAEWADGPLVVTTDRFHRPDCPWVRHDAARRDIAADPVALLKAGRSPCRTCLPWPP